MTINTVTTPDTRAEVRSAREITLNDNDLDSMIFCTMPNELMMMERNRNRDSEQSSGIRKNKAMYGAEKNSIR